MMKKKKKKTGKQMKTPMTSEREMLVKVHDPELLAGINEEMRKNGLRLELGGSDPHCKGGPTCRCTMRVMPLGEGN
jgi:hypothetical protein